MPNLHRRPSFNRLFNNFEGIYQDQPRISASSLLIGIVLSLIFIALTYPVHGDDLTGQPDDPKDLLPQSTTLDSSIRDLFQPLPGWARGIKMPPLPDQLKPMGKPATIAPASAAVTPSKDVLPATPTAPVTVVAKPETPTPPTPKPELIAVSPFLQWVQSDPKAADEARQQAGQYKTPAPADPDKGPVIESPYWLPPLIDTLGTSPQPVEGSAAIYQTPQR